jgi:hypothetical protein
LSAPWMDGRSARVTKKRLMNIRSLFIRAK